MRWYILAQPLEGVIQVRLNAQLAKSSILQDPDAVAMTNVRSPGVTQSAITRRIRYIDTAFSGQQDLMAHERLIVLWQTVLVDTAMEFCVRFARLQFQEADFVDFKRLVLVLSHQYAETKVKCLRREDIIDIEQTLYLATREAGEAEATHGHWHGLSQRGR